MGSQEIYFSLALLPVFVLFYYGGFYLSSLLLRMPLPFAHRTKKTRVKIEKFFSYFFMITGFAAALDSFLLSVWMGCSVSMAICLAAFIRLLMGKKEEKTI